MLVTVSIVDLADRHLWNTDILDKEIGIVSKSKNPNPRKINK